MLQAGKNCFQMPEKNASKWAGDRTSSMPGMVFTPSRFSVLCSRLSSVEVVLCTAFFFLRGGQE